MPYGVGGAATIAITGPPPDATRTKRLVVPSMLNGKNGPAGDSPNATLTGPKAATADGTKTESPPLTLVSANADDTNAGDAGNVIDAIGYARAAAASCGWDDSTIAFARCQVARSGTEAPAGGGPLYG
jgi:hypothetical protein